MINSKCNRCQTWLNTYLSINSKLIFGISFDVGCKTNHRIATFIGVVKQEVNKSAGRSGFIGNTWLPPQAANWIQFLNEGAGGTLFPSFCCWDVECLNKKNSTHQSYSKI